MNHSSLPVKWLLGGAAVILVLSGFITGRMTGGADSILPRGAGSSSSSSGSDAKTWTAGGDETSGDRSLISQSPSALGAPAGGYTKDSLIELTKSIGFSSGGGPRKLRDVLAIQESLAQQDVRALVDELIAEDSPNSREALFLAMGVLTEQSPREALELALALTDSRQMEPAIFQAFAASMEKDPEGAIAAAEVLPEARRNYIISKMIGSWASQDPEAALGWLATSDSPAVVERSIQSIAYSGEVAPDIMFNLVMEKMPAGNSFSNTLSEVVSRWAKSDPLAAASALQALPPGNAYTRSAVILTRQWSKDDPAAAYQWANSLPEGGAKIESVRNWFASTARNDLQMVESYYSQLDAKQQSSIAQTVVTSLAMSDSSAAVRFNNSITDEKLRKRTQESLAQYWAYRNPAEAGKWANTLPESEKSRAIEKVMNVWAGRNIEAAAEWLASVPASPALDPASRKLSQKLVGIDPEAAISWAESIVNEKQRQQAIYDAARRWVYIDSDSGKSWVRNSSLSQEEKQKLLN